MRHLVFGLLFSLLVMPAQAAWDNNAYVEKAFELIALNNEYDDKDHPVRKWHQPVNVWIDHRVGDKELHTMLVRMHLAHLSKVTGHKVQLVDKLEKANLRMVFTRQSRWQAETRELWNPNENYPFRGAICMAHFSVTKSNEIRRGLIVIPVDLARERGKLFACVVEELTQAMGLPNDSNEVFPSIFNDNTKNSVLTPLDVTLLRLLYSSKIRAGMSGNTVLPLVSAWLNANPSWAKESKALARQSEFVTELGLF
ncbi:DUF2927 domain-containing protein [Enterovibrio baiacu]|uniref:DUF2927 domain-containing protein n=1 Tax=Enterovibrio baiacu TaxID=2491023 RepID=UPI0010131172|nr:DUF2927 domain-containing protein [Enterovibrio baiacu]MBE1277409.1 DUF2927 domain-containing protein [Enterovibrio baiacu]